MAPRLSPKSNNRKTDQLIRPLYLRDEVTLLDAKMRGLEVVTAIADTVYQERDFVGVIEQAVELILELTQFTSVAIFGFDKAKHRLELISHKGITSDSHRIASKIALSDSFTNLAIKDKLIINSIEIGQDKRIDQKIASALEKEGKDCVISVPMLAKEKVIGAINLTFSDMRFLTDDESQILLAIAKTIGLAFINAHYVSQIEHEIKRRERAEIKLQEANEKLEEEVARQTRELNHANQQLHHANEELTRQIKQRHYESITDKLSGLYSTPYFDVRINSEIEHAQRYQRPLSMLMVDIDDFRNFNEQFGREKGNEIICSVGKAIRNNIRSVDSGFRYTGEQFIVLLPETESENATIVAERIRTTINQSSVDSESRDHPVSVSIGLIQCHSDDSKEKLLQRAEQAMSEAKERGKNCIHVS